MAGVDLSGDGLAAFDYPYSSSRLSWPLPIGQRNNLSRTMPHQRSAKRSTTPLQQSHGHAYDQIAQHQHPIQPQAIIPDWHLPQQPSTNLPAYTLGHSYPSQYNQTYSVPYQTAPTDFMPTQQQYDTNTQPNYGIDTQTHYDSSLPMDGASYLPTNPQMDSMPFNWQGYSNDLMTYPTANAFTHMNLPPANPLSDINLAHHLPNSPNDTSLEVLSLASSNSDNGWTSIDYPSHSLDGSGSYSDPQLGAIFNPGQTLHCRTLSDSSYSDVEQQSRFSLGSFVELPQHAIGSPTSDSMGEIDFSSDTREYQGYSRKIKQEPQQSSPPAIVSSTSVKPLRIKTSTSPQRSPTSTGRVSPPGKRQPRKSNHGKATKPTIRRQNQGPKVETEKRVGRRKGPLRPDQRKQACQIRKLGACLRCRFLKKPCDKGEPCAGCKPLHARLWQVPCTRIDIKEIAYFMKDWKADYERHPSLEFSLGNIRGFADTEQTLYITHGYGHMLPVHAREVYVRDASCFGLDWTEAVNNYSFHHSVNTARLSAGLEGISTALLSEYLDQHIDFGFPSFVDEYFEGTPFLTGMLKTVHRFWVREGTPVIRKSLKLLLAYNLTQHVTMVEGIPDEERFSGRICDRTSKFYGKIVAPVMINFQVKRAMGDMWRELQKEILEELSHLYSSVYTKDKLTHWPTIFMVVCILLAVWEEMQFDCHFRIPEENVADEFCNEMEAVPVGVVVGLFSAISQKLPSLQEWDRSQHHHLLKSNSAVCDAMDDFQENVTRNDKYLRTRCDTAFDRDDFDSLTNKFASKLVIRASAG